jgi:hypothetical protein
MDCDWEKLCDTLYKTNCLKSKAGLEILKHCFNVARYNTKILGKYTRDEWIEANKDKPYVLRTVQYKTEKRGYSLEDALNQCFELYSRGGSVRLFRPAISAFLIDRYGAKSMLDPCAGWGGRCLGAMSRDVDYTGFDTNPDLIDCFKSMIDLIGNKTDSKVSFICGDTSKHIIPKLSFDMVLTSPPYWKSSNTLLEKYEGMPDYANEDDFNTRFLKPVVLMSFDALKFGGAFCISTDTRQYSFIKSILGDETEKFDYPRTNKKHKFLDFIYVWIKPSSSA